MNIGFIGVGGIAGNYLNSLDKIEGVSVTAICEINESRAQAIAQPRGARIYSDHKVMIEKEELEAIFIAIPPFAHSDQEITAAQKGINLFCAKPVAIDLETALKAQEAIKKAGIINNVGYMWRYSDLTSKADEIISGKKIGLALGYALVGVAGGPTHWWREKAKSGGQILEQATHIYDLTRYFCGDVIELHALGGRELIPDRVDFEDVTTVNLKFASGAIGNVSSTSAVKGGGRYAIELIGKDWHLNLQYAQNSLSGIVDGERFEFKATESGYYKQVEVFIEAVRAKNQALLKSSFADGVKSLALTIAANKALQSGKVESVPITDY